MKGLLTLQESLHRFRNHLFRLATQSDLHTGRSILSRVLHTVLYAMAHRRLFIKLRTWRILNGLRPELSQVAQPQLVALQERDHHVHTRNRSSSSPSVSVDDPALIIDPLDFGERLLHQSHDLLVDRGALPVQEAELR
jgi:hypothetical protein